MKKTTLCLIAATTFLSACGDTSTDEKISNGQNALASGNYREATIEFKSALQKDSASIPARIGLADILIRERKINEAITELEIAKSLPTTDEESSAIVQRLAYAYFEQRTPEKIKALPQTAAVKYFMVLDGQDVEVDTLDMQQSQDTKYFITLTHETKKIINNASIDVAAVEAIFSGSANYLVKASAALSLAEYGSRTKNEELVIDSMRHYLTIFPQDAGRQLQLIDLLVSVQKYDEAEPLAERLHAKNKQHSLLNELLGVIKLQQKAYDEALSFSRVATANDPGNVRARITSALSELGKEQPVRAREQLDFIKDRLPADHMINYLYIDLLAQERKYQDATKHALKTTPTNESSAEQLAKTGMHIAQQGQTKLASDIYNHLKNTEISPTVSMAMLALTLNDQSGLATLEKLRKEDPDSLMLNHTVAAAYLATGDLTQAEKLADEWIALKGEANTEGKMLKAVVHARKGNWTAAHDTYLDVLKTSPDHILASAGIIETHVMMGNPSKAEMTILDLSDKEQAPTLLRHYAGAMLKEKKTDDAEAFLKSLTEKNTDPLAADATMLMAQMAFVKKDYQGALDTIKSGPASMEDQPGYWFMLAMLNQTLNNTEATKQAYHSWLKAEPASKQALMGAVSAYSRTGDTNQAILLLKEARSHHGDTLPIDIMMIQMMTQNEQWQDALSLSRSLPEEVRSSPTISGFEGMAQAATGDITAAEPKLQRAFDAKMNDDLLRFLVSVQERRRNFDGAKRNLERYISENGKDPLGHMLLGNNRGMVQDWSGAVKSFEQAISLGETAPLLLNNYAYSLLQIGQIEKATTFAKKAFDALPANIQVADTLANAYLSNNSAKDAVAILLPFHTKGALTSDNVMGTLLKALAMDKNHQKAKELYLTYPWESDNSKEKYSPSIQ